MNHHLLRNGYVYLITVDVDAREALEINLRLQEMFPGIPIVVRWTGLTAPRHEWWGFYTP